MFSEWKSLDDSKVALEKEFSHPPRWHQENMPVFKRKVFCSRLIPWFYAIGDEQLKGDYVLPSTLQDDPVFRLG